MQAFAALPLFAQAPTISVQVDKQEIYLGESFSLSVLIQDIEKPVTPDLSHLKECKVEPQGSRFINQSSTRYINGKIVEQRRQGYELSYRVTPDAIGPFSVHSIKAVVNGQTLSSPTLTVNVVGPQDQDVVLLHYYANQTNLTVYEEAELTLEVLIKQLPESYTDVEPLFPASPPMLQCDIFDGEAPQGLTSTNSSDLLRPLLQQGRTAGFNINNIALQNGPFSLGGLFGRELAKFQLPHTIKTVNGTPYYAYSFKRRYTAPTMGLYEMGPASLKGLIPTGINRDGPISTNLFVVSDKVVLNVTEPSGAREQQHYAGAIGENVSIRAELNLQTCDVGDPITLSLTVKGALNQDDIRPLKLSRNKAIAPLFDVYDDHVKTSKSGDEKTFYYTLRPRKAGTIEVPPIAFSYFDLGTRDFTTLYTRTIPLRVNETHQISTSDILQPMPTNSTGRLYQDAVQNDRISGISLSTKGITTTPLFEHWHWQLAALGPLAFLFVMLAKGGVHFRSARQATRSSRSVLSRAHHLLDEASSRLRNNEDGIDQLILEAIRLILSRPLVRSPESITPDDVPVDFFHFSEFSEEEVNRLCRIFEECFNAGFSQSKADVHQSDIELLIRLMRAIRS
jgi:hypothetical protein